MTDKSELFAAKTPYMWGEIEEKIIKIKAALMSALIIIVEPDKYSAIEKLKIIKNLYDILPVIREIPRPTKENCRYPNSFKLLEIRDWLIPCIRGLEIRANVIELIFDAIIILYEYDCPYRFLIDCVFDKIIGYEKEGNWLAARHRFQGKPIHYVWWKEQHANE